MGRIADFLENRGMNRDRAEKYELGTYATAGIVIIGGSIYAIGQSGVLEKVSLPDMGGDQGGDGAKDIAVEKVGIEEVIKKDAFKKVADDDDDIKEQLGNGDILSAEKMNFANGSMLIEAHMKAKDNTPYDVQIMLPADKAKDVRSDLKGKETYLIPGDDGKMEFEGQAAMDVAKTDLGMSDEDALNVDKVVVKAYANYADQDKSFALAKAYDANGNALNITEDGAQMVKLTDFAKVDNLVDKFDNTEDDDSTEKYTQGKNVKVLEMGDKFIEKYEWAVDFAKDIGITEDLFGEDLEEVLEEITDHITATADDIYKRGKWDAVFAYAANIVNMTGADATEVNENLTAFKEEKNVTGAAKYLEGVVNGWIDVKKGDWEDTGKNAILDSWRDSIVTDYKQYFDRVNVTEDDVKEMDETGLWGLTKDIIDEIKEDADNDALNLYRAFIVKNYGPGAEVDYLTELGWTTDQVNDTDRPGLEDLEKQIDEEIKDDGRDSATPAVIDSFREGVWAKYGPDSEYNLLALKNITERDHLNTADYDTTTELLDLVSDLEDLEDQIDRFDAGYIVANYGNDKAKLDQVLTNLETVGYEVIRFDHTAQGESAYANLTENLTTENKTFSQKLGFNWSPVYELNNWTVEIYKTPNPSGSEYAVEVVRDKDGEIRKDYTRTYTKEQVEYVEDHS